ADRTASEPRNLETARTCGSAGGRPAERGRREGENAFNEAVIRLFRNRADTASIAAPVGLVVWLLPSPARWLGTVVGPGAGRPRFLGIGRVAVDSERLADRPAPCPSGTPTSPVVDMWLDIFLYSHITSCHGTSSDDSGRVQRGGRASAPTDPGCPRRRRA